MNSKDFTLLYVEDDPVAQEWMQVIFDGQFKEYYQAYNGQEGLELYKKYKPDIILTDINMPQLNGLEMAEQIKAIDKNQAIIVMSAFDDKETLLKAINIGIDYFAPKPVNMEVLNEKIDNVVQTLFEQRELKRLQEKEMQELHYLAHYDTLTGIQNRFHFEKNLRKILNRANRIGHEVICFFIDLDNFKVINDTYGHAAGDEVLRNTVENINKVIRDEDTFARISGDEFALIMEVSNENKCEADTIANKIIEALSTDIIFNEKPIKVSCSIGISCFPDDATTVEELLRNADLAMYEAKKQGKSTYSYHSK